MVISERRILLKHAGTPGYTNDLACYIRHDGYKSLPKALEMGPEAVCREVADSGLRGRGGAGFPTGMKWKFLDRTSGKPIYLIANADESEPGTFKDRQIIYKDPHQLLEGMIISAFAVQAQLAFIYIRGEMYEGARILEHAIQEARKRNFLGDNILGSNYSCDILVHRGLKRAKIDQAVGTYLNNRQWAAPLAQKLAAIEHSGMFGCQRNYPPAILRYRGECALDGPIRRLGSAAGEIEISAICAETGLDLIAGNLDGRCSLAAHLVR